MITLKNIQIYTAFLWSQECHSTAEHQILFSKLTFQMNKKIKTWSNSLQIPHANEAKF